MPDAAWRMAITDIFETDNEVWILVKLDRPSGMAAQMIMTAQVALPVTLPKKKYRIFVAGKTWGWPNEESYEFVPTLDAVVKRAANAKRLFPSGV